MSNKIEGKYPLELNLPGDGRIFLNHWDWAHGNDVCAEVIHGELYVDGKKVSFVKYLDMVLNSIKIRKV